jgi:hypothetical protein
MKNEKMRNDERVFFLDSAKRSSTTLSEKPRKRKRLLRDSKRLPVSLPLEIVDVIPPSERSAESVWVEKVVERRSTALTIAGRLTCPNWANKNNCCSFFSDFLQASKDKRKGWENKCLPQSPVERESVRRICARLRLPRHE